MDSKQMAVTLQIVHVATILTTTADGLKNLFQRAESYAGIDPLEKFSVRLIRKVTAEHGPMLFRLRDDAIAMLDRAHKNFGNAAEFEKLEGELQLLRPNIETLFETFNELGKELEKIESVEQN